MRPLLAALGLVGALALPAQAADALTGSWFSDVTGEVITITDAGDFMDTAFLATGPARLSFIDLPGDAAKSGPPQAGVKMTFNTGIVSSDECTYRITRISDDRMIWTVTKGGDKCPRGAFTLAAPTTAAKVPDEARKPREPVRKDKSGSPVRTAETLRGTWKSRSGTVLLVRRAFNGWDINLDRLGQGSLIARGDDNGTVEITFGPTACILSARIVDGDLILKPQATAHDECPVGQYSRL